MAIVGPSKVAMADSINFTTTKTLRGETVNVNSISGYVVDLDGNIYDNSGGGTSATVTFVGGLHTFINEKVYREPTFYITVRQKMTLYNIIKNLSTRAADGNITSDVEQLELIAQSIYANMYG